MSTIPFDPLQLVNHPICFHDGHHFYCGYIEDYYSKTHLYEFIDYDTADMNILIAVLLEADGSYGLYTRDTKIQWYIPTVLLEEEIEVLQNRKIKVFSLVDQQYHIAEVKQYIRESSISLLFEGETELRKYEIYEWNAPYDYSLKVLLAIERGEMLSFTVV